MAEIQTKSDVLVEIENVSVHFPIKQSFLDSLARKPQKVLKAVDDVSLQIYKGETLGLVGESGCGKSTLARAIVRLYEPDSGSITFDGVDVTHMKDVPLRSERKKFQMIFQDPYSSLNPRMSVRAMLTEVLRVHHIDMQDSGGVEKRIYELLDMVGLSASAIDRFPGEFSGGQRQRLGIARALAVNPSFIIADEPVSALDVSIQAQVINLIMDIQEQRDITYLFISHDLRVVRMISHRTAVMYLGKVVELGETEMLFDRPLHPYTKILTLAAPVLDATQRERDYVIEGDPPSPVDVPPGCRFHPRCPYAKERCRAEQPQLRELLPEHFVSCHFPLNEV